VLIAWLTALAIVFGAQTNESRLMGVVTDGSGGSLPGVTVSVRTANGPTSTVITDGAGRYLTGWLQPGVYTVTFTLSGFETRIVNSVALGAGQTIVLDQQLSLASLSETVEVTAPAPKPPPPPAPATPRPPRGTPRPEAKPVDKELLASVCGPRQATSFSQAIGRIVSHRDDPNRQLMGPGDVLRIDVGEKQGITNGQNYVVRRKFQIGDRSASKKEATFAEEAAGLIQILDVQTETASALVVYVCGELVAGDTVEPYMPQPAFFAVSDGMPRFDETARITAGEGGRSAATAGQMMAIDRGIMQGVQRGQRVTIFRRQQGVEGLPLTIGDGVIVSIRADSATIRIERATDAITVGDLVALHR
jgi:hypothetical protein